MTPKLTPDSSLTVTPSAQKIVEWYAAERLADRELRNIKYCDWKFFYADVTITFFDEDNHGEWLHIADPATLPELKLFLHEKQLMTVLEAYENDHITADEYRHIAIQSAFEDFLAADDEANDLEDMFHF